MNEQAQPHFVAYHNIDIQDRPLWRGREGSFDTNKPVLPEKEDILWCFEGEGRTKQFRLVKRATISRSRKGRDGSVIHYDDSLLVDADVNDLPWFAELRKEQSSFSFGVNRIRNAETIDALEQFAATRGLHKARFTDLCAYTIRHSSTLKTYADGRPHTIDTGSTSWARFADILSSKKPGQAVPLLFAPAEDFSAEITGCAELQQVKTAKRDQTNEVTFTNFRFLSSPLPRAAVTRDNGNSLAGEQYAYAICRTPADLARRLASSSEADDIAEIEKDPTVPETERVALIKARLGQGPFREQLDEI
jgi:hypothetical protein